MIYYILNKILGTNTQTLDFILDKKSGVWKRLSIIIPISLWATILSIVSPLFIKWELDAITQKWTSINGGILNIQLKDTFQVVVAILLASLALGILNQFLWWLRNRISEIINYEADSYLEDKFNKYLQRFDSSFLGAENNLRLVRNLQWSLNALQNQFLKLIQLLIEIPISIIGLLAVVQFLHPYLMILVVAFTIIFMSIDTYKAKVWRQYEIVENRLSEQKNQLSWRVVWYFNNFLTNGWLNNVYKLYTDKRAKWFEFRKKQVFKDQNISFASSILYEISNFCNLALAAFLVITDKITLGTLSVFGYYGDRIKELLNKVGELFKIVIEMRYNLFRLSFLLNMKPKLDYSNITPFEEKDIDSIEFKNVTFAYPAFFEDERKYLNSIKEKLGVTSDKPKNIVQKVMSLATPTGSNKEIMKELEELDQMFDSAGQNKIILNNLNFKLNKGRIYAIVGYNGAGKTTLTRLIKRTLDSQQGDIMINSRAIKSIDPLLIKQYISSLEQNSYLIDSLTVRDNLLMGATRTITDDEIWTILKELGLDGSIKSLDQIVGEGVSFSGGQAQLIELTRILLNPKPIVILDEGTNQLDAIKEAKVMELIKQKTKDCIVIFITHRMTTCNKCDEVIVIDQGKLEVSGKPAELLKGKNLFRTFWDVQVKVDEV